MLAPFGDPFRQAHLAGERIIGASALFGFDGQRFARELGLILEAVLPGARTFWAGSVWGATSGTDATPEDG